MDLNCFMAENRKDHRLHGERPCQFHDVFECHVSLAPFDSTDIVPMQSGSFRKLLLRIAALLPQGPEPFPKRDSVMSYAPLMFFPYHLSLHTMSVIL